MQKDNAGLLEKLAIRREAISHISLDQRRVLETHGGYGVIGKRLYSEYSGCVFDIDPIKTKRLCIDRPTWGVYQCRAENALAAGVGRWISPTIIDIDPYGQCWEIVDSLVLGGALTAEKAVIIVNDGLRQRLKRSAYGVKSLEGILKKYSGETVYANYLEVCREMITGKISDAGYGVDSFVGAYGGHSLQMTHFYCVISKKISQNDE